MEPVFEENNSPKHIHLESTIKHSAYKQNEDGIQHNRYICTSLFKSQGQVRIKVVKPLR